MKPVPIIYFGANMPAFVHPEQAAAAIAQGLAIDCWILPCPSPSYFRFMIAAWLRNIVAVVTRRTRN
jgi:hypothetical protein